MAMPPCNCKKRTAVIPGIVIYMSKFSPMTAEVCKLLWKLTLVDRMVREWNVSRSTQQGQKHNKQHVCMKFYDASKLLYLEIDASSINLEAGFLQIRRDTMNCRSDEVLDNTALCPTAFTSKRFHHYCSAKEVNKIIDHKPLVAMVSKDITMLSQWLQCIILHIHWYNMCILYKAGPDLQIMDCLSHHNHTIN